MSANCALTCGNCSAPGPASLALYRRSWEYLDIINNLVTGVWSVPLVMDGIFITHDVTVELERMLTAIAASSAMESAIIREEQTSFFITALISQMLRKAGVHLHVTNMATFGHIIDNSNYDATKVRPDVYLLEGNKVHWTAVYLHPHYDRYPQVTQVRPECPEIYNFPLFTETFCNEFVEQAEAYGGWSGASKEGGKATYDERIQGGVEPVPTQDIHFTQKGMDFESTWKLILRTFVAPVAESKWDGYTVDGRATLDFIVKYTPEGQPFLRPHHDASTFSLNVALNRIGIDFTGGGTRFLRQNCTVLTNDIGHALIHPGRLTHYHEGLYVTNGTRYILVSFVDQ